LAHLVPKESEWNTRHVELGTMRVYLAWSGSRQKLRGRPCKYVFLSEIDVYRGDKKAGDPIAAADQRVKAFYSHLIIRESSPTGEPSPIAELEAQSDQRRWHVPCPHCGVWQELRFFTYRAGALAGRGGFAGLQDADGNWLSAEEARQTAHYVCVAGCKIPNEHKQAMILAGRWVPKGQKLIAGQLTGTPARGPRHAGAHLWAIHADTSTLGDIAAAYLTARVEGKLPDFHQNWLGLSYTPRAKMPTWEQLGRRLAWQHQRGEVWHEAWFLTCGCDVQDDRVYYVVRAWGDAVTSWLVDWGVFDRLAGDEAQLVKSDLAQLSALLKRKYPVVGGEGVNPLKKTALAIKLLGIDSNYRVLDVHRWIESRGRPARVRAVRGDHKIAPEEKYRAALVEANTRTGEKYPGGLMQWGIYVSHFKQDLAERMAGRRGQPGSWHVTADARVRGKDYLKPWVNEPKQIEVNAQGRKRTVWKPRSTMLGVDYWDCEVYGRALADMIVDALPERDGRRVGWDARLWPRRTSAPPGGDSGGDYSARDFDAPLSARD
jgi:phage terminase large subunit GpA-like protein